jgi:ribosomal protein S12 methylthiotransferase
MTRSRKIQSVAFVSLGCPKNLVDSERMLGMLAEEGIAIEADPAKAQAIVINTCGFLQAAKDESLGEIRKALDFKKTGQCQRVIVAGCLAQREKAKLLQEVPEVDQLVGVFDRSGIVAAVRGGKKIPVDKYLGKYHSKMAFEDDRSRLRLTPRHYAYLRISEGCNQGCAFCTIPSIRGPLRSKPVRDILREGEELAADGALELNLIGQDTTSYGTDLKNSPGLAQLLRTLNDELPDSIRWIRLMYAYPSQFTDEMIRAIAECDRVVKYIDIPLQHINDEMLNLMKRKVTRAQTERLLVKLRKNVPGIAIRTTLIAGAPGETDAMHEELVDFVREQEFDMLGVFPYSQEKGTAMGRMKEQVPPAIRQLRANEIMAVQQKIAFKKAKKWIGKTIEALIEEGLEEKGKFMARAAFQAPEIDSAVVVKGKNLETGQMAKVKITESQGYDLAGEVSGKSLKVL